MPFPETNGPPTPRSNLQGAHFSLGTPGVPMHPHQPLPDLDSEPCARKHEGSLGSRGQVLRALGEEDPATTLTLIFSHH